MNSPPKETKTLLSPSPPKEKKTAGHVVTPASNFKTKFFKASRLNAALAQTTKTAADTAQKRANQGKELLRTRIDKLQTEFKQMSEPKELVPLAKLLSPRKNPVKTRRMKPFSPRHSYKQPMLTVYSEMSSYNKLAKMAIPYDKPFYIPVAPNARDNPLKIQSQAEIAKGTADFIRNIDPPVVNSIRRGYLGAKSPLSKRLTREHLSNMVSMKHQKEGFLEKHTFYEAELSATKRYGNKKYNPVQNLKEYEKAYKYHKDAANSAVTPIFFGFDRKKKKRVKIFVKEALQNQVVEDLYFGQESEATLSKFLDLLQQIEIKMATMKDLNTLKKTFEQFDVDKSGTLSRTEFMVGLLEIGITINEEDKKLLFHYFDPNNDGVITLSEFLSTMNNRRSVAGKKGKQLKFDKNAQTNNVSTKDLEKEVEATKKV
jgi:Ca2+-binding EF-hand superfamily protein